MRFAHIADLHIGKKLNETDLSDDQNHILSKIVDICIDEKVDTLLISGDVYDRANPAADDVGIFNDFISLAHSKIENIFIIPGNHDSAGRLSCHSELVSQSKVYFEKGFDGLMHPYHLKDEYGDITVWMLPFFSMPDIRTRYEASDLTGAFERILEASNVDPNGRNILLAHQYFAVSGKENIFGGSESVQIGGLDSIESEKLNCFDYVALGHIHKPMDVAFNARYCGSPLAYSVNEADQEKSVTIIEDKGKKDVTRYTVPLVPKRKIVRIEGTMQDLSFHPVIRDDLVYITLIIDDSIDNEHSVQSLKKRFPNCIKIEYVRERKLGEAEINMEKIKEKDPLELFSEFFESLQNKQLSPEQKEIFSEILKEVEQ